MTRSSIRVRGWSADKAVAFADLARRFASKVRLHSQDDVVDGKSMIGVLSLGPARAGEVVLEVEGYDEKDAFALLHSKLAEAVSCSRDDAARLGRLTEQFGIDEDQAAHRRSRPTEWPGITARGSVSLQRARRKVVGPVRCPTQSREARRPALDDFWLRLLDVWRRMPSLPSVVMQPVRTMRLGPREGGRGQRERDTLGEAIRSLGVSEREESACREFAHDLEHVLRRSHTNRQAAKLMGQVLARAQTSGLPATTLRRVAAEVVIRLKAAPDGRKP